MGSLDFRVVLIKGADHLEELLDELVARRGHVVGEGRRSHFRCGRAVSAVRACTIALVDRLTCCRFLFVM